MMHSTLPFAVIIEKKITTFIIIIILSPHGMAVLQRLTLSETKRTNFY